MESMSNAPYLLDGRTLRPAARRRHGPRRDARATASRARGAASTWPPRRREVAAELEITRADMDRWAVRSHERADRRDRRRPHGGGDRRGDACRRARATRSSSRTRRRAATRRSRRSPSCRRSSSRTARTPPATRPASTTAPARSSSRASDWASANGREPLGTIVATAQAADDFPYLARTPALAARGGAREGRARRLAGRPVGDQRGVRVGRDLVDPDARHRRGAASTSTAARSRSVIRSAPPARASSRRSCTSCAAAAAASAAPRSAPAAPRATPSSCASDAELA